jgi:hypothetical protein
MLVVIAIDIGDGLLLVFGIGFDLGRVEGTKIAPQCCRIRKLVSHAGAAHPALYLVDSCMCSKQHMLCLLADRMALCQS